MQLLVLAAVIFASSTGFFAERQGRSPFAWGISGLLFGPVALLLVLASAAKAGAMASRPIVRPWLLLVALFLSTIVGAYAGAAIAIDAAGVDPVRAATDVAHQAGSEAGAASGAVVVGAGAMVWDGAVGMFGILSGALSGFMLCPFVGLLFEAAVRATREGRKWRNPVAGGV